MIKIKCPECRLELEADNVIGGHRLACECGAKWAIPDVPPRGDLRFCAACGRITTADAAVCPECSFNFLSGRRPPQPVAPTRSSWLAEHRAMLIKLTLLVLLSGLGWGVYAYATRSKIGVSAACPLGKIDRDGRYNELVFKPFTGKASPQLQANGLTTLAYAETPESPPDIVLAVDAARRVHAIGGSFTDGTNLLGFKEASSAARAFFLRLQKELAIPVFTEFQETRRGSDRFAYTEFSVEYRRAGFTYFNRHTDRSFHSARTLSHRELYHLDALPREKVLELTLSTQPDLTDTE